MVWVVFSGLPKKETVMGEDQHVKEWQRQAAVMRLARLKANVEQHLQPNKDREQIARELYAQMEAERLERLAASPLMKDDVT